MYNILLADDELPSLRFLETIITKYTTDFQVVNKLRDGASALSWLRDHADSVDLLITDIRMPDMDGITLAKAARRLNPDLHIVIVSGYSEFEYAHGAIEASVDDYLLKPISISHMRDLLERIKYALDNAVGQQLIKELSAMLTQKPYHKEVIRKRFGGTGYYFALLRYGNVIYPQSKLTETGFTDRYSSELFQSLTGRDEHEFLFFAAADRPISGFQNAIRELVKNSDIPTITTVFSGSAMDFTEMGSFYVQASRILRHEAVIGFHREMLFADYDHDTEAPPAGQADGQTTSQPPQESGKTSASRSSVANVPNTILRQLELAANENNRKKIRSLFTSLGNSWDKNRIPQRQAYVMMQQLLHLIEALRREHWKTTDKILQDADQLTNTVTSYTELTDKLYELLYEREPVVSKQMSPEEMYQYAVKTVNEKFDQPINIQSICSEIGISQTYLSRLFRKYGNISFNAFLIQCRMDNAQRLMREHPDMPLHQIAACAGYEDYAYFSKVFHQIVGCSPSQFQEKIIREQTEE